LSTIVVSQPFLFPWVGLFEQIKLADVYVHYDDVQFVRRSFHDRVQIKTQNGYKWMTVPKKYGNQNQLICEVQIDNSQNWKQSHIDFLKQTYGKANFRNEMLQVVEDVYQNEFINLHKLTVSSIMAVVEYFDLTQDRVFQSSSMLNIEGKRTQRLLDIVKFFKGKKYITGMGALKYFDFDMFENENISVEFVNYKKTPYSQLFGDFNPYVSVLDLIANHGKEGTQYIHSGSVYWKDFVEMDVAKNYLNNQ